MKNLEIKARFNWSHEVDDILEEIDAKFETAEIQTDTYFDVNSGRIKIRERQGKDAQMIQYFRDDKADIKECRYSLVNVRNPESVKSILTREHSIREVVQKHREVWIWQNVRIHFDKVKKLGSFIELEAVIDDDNPVDISENRIRELMVKFDIKKHNLIEQSYIDLLESLEKSKR
ncbi:MAG: class IV adenylate cyclase [bacterium]